MMILQVMKLQKTERWEMIMTEKEMADAWLEGKYLENMGVRRPCKVAFLAGLKAGRPKWHKVADGDLPKEMENVLCYCKGAGIKFCCVGHTIVGGDKKARWWANNKSEELLVIKWKEIILDEEE